MKLGETNVISNAQCIVANDDYRPIFGSKHIAYNNIQAKITLDIRKMKEEKNAQSTRLL